MNGLLALTAFMLLAAAIATAWDGRLLASFGCIIGANLAEFAFYQVQP